MSGPRINTDRKWSYADYYTWEDMLSKYVFKRCELIDGVEFDFITPTPPPIHQVVSLNLAVQFADHLKGNKQCEVLTAPLDVRLPDAEGHKEDHEIFTVVQPDIIVTCDPAKLDDRGGIGAPDLLIEILSPTTAAYDMTMKFELYESVGVKEFWLVHPTDRTVMVFKLSAAGKYGRPDRYGSCDRIPVPMLGDLVVNLDGVFDD